MSEDNEKTESEEQSEDTVADLLSAIQGGPEQRSVMLVGEVNEERAADFTARVEQVDGEEVACVARTRRDTHETRGLSCDHDDGVAAVRSHENAIDAT